MTGRIAALNMFIARSTYRCMPFYHLLRTGKNTKFKWDDTYENAFQELKWEPLYLYVAVS